MRLVVQWYSHKRSPLMDNLASKEIRNAGMKKVMGNPRMSDENNPMPFYVQRLIYGGFQMIVSD